MRRVPIGEFIPAAGHTFHVRQDGDPQGRPLVLLHGFCGSVHWFDRLTPLLANDFRVIRVDLLGHGCTGGRTDLAAQGQGRALAALLDALDLREAAVAGHSFGADVTLALAAHSPRVREVVVIAQGPDYRGASLPPGARYLVGLMSAAARLVAPWPLTRWAGRFLPTRLFDDPLREVLDHAATAPGMAELIFVDRGRVLARDPLDAQLRELGRPALAVLGERDRYYDCARTAARYTAAGAQVRVVPGGSHSPFLLQAEVVGRLLREFLGVRPGPR